MAAVKRNLANEFRNALVEAKESIDGKRKLYTLNGLIDDLQAQQAATETKPGSMAALEAFREIRKMAEAGQFPDLTLDEINEEIRLAREERAAREKTEK